jgi:hypothetical protein
MNSDHPRQRAENSFKQGGRSRDVRHATSEYETQARVIREKIARLRALRLAKEAEAQNTESASQPARGNNKRRTDIRREK